MIDTCPICNTPGVLHHRPGGVNSFEPFREWEPTPENIAALPKPLRDFVRQLIREAAQGEDTIAAGLETRDAEIERLRDRNRRQEVEVERLRAEQAAREERIARLQEALRCAREQLDFLDAGLGLAKGHAQSPPLAVDRFTKRRPA